MQNQKVGAPGGTHIEFERFALGEANQLSCIKPAFRCIIELLDAGSQYQVFQLRYCLLVRTHQYLLCW